MPVGKDTLPELAPVAGVRLAVTNAGIVTSDRADVVVIELCSDAVWRRYLPATPFVPHRSLWPGAIYLQQRRVCCLSIPAMPMPVPVSKVLPTRLSVVVAWPMQRAYRRSKYCLFLPGLSVSHCRWARFARPCPMRCSSCRRRPGAMQLGEFSLPTRGPRAPAVGSC